MVFSNMVFESVASAHRELSNNTDFWSGSDLLTRNSGGGARHRLFSGNSVTSEVEAWRHLYCVLNLFFSPEYSTITKV